MGRITDDIADNKVKKKKDSIVEKILVLHNNKI